MDDFLPAPESTRRGRPLPLPSLDPEVAAPIAFVVGLIVTLLSALAMPTALDISLGRGTHGVYVVADQPRCGPDRCRTHHGRFTSDDGKVVRSAVGLTGSPLGPLKQGDRVRAFDVGDSTKVYLEGDSWPPRAVLPWFFGIAGVIAMALGLGYVVREWWRSRKAKGPGA